MFHAMIMAGGKGTRFWPLSREKKPKQFLSMISDISLIDACINRIAPLSKPEQRWILGNVTQKDHLSTLNSKIPSKNILQEPMGKNTAACIGWAAFEALKQDPDAICGIFSADAWISPDNLFQECINKAIQEVESNNTIVTIGIPPTSPHTGYGYIEVPNSQTETITPINAFVEKPNAETALTYLQSGHHFWNAGIFIMKAATIIDCIKTHLPNHYTHIRAFSEANLRNPDDIAPYYSQLDPISIDVGIMEKVSDQIRLIRAPFQWSDIGSWASLDEFLPKDSQNNAIKGPVCLHESSNNIIVSDKKLISLSHVNDLIVVDSPDALLILPKNNDQSIKNLYEKLPDTVK